jgi:hypothetical protein
MASLGVLGPMQRLGRDEQNIRHRHNSRHTAVLPACRGRMIYGLARCACCLRGSLASQAIVSTIVMLRVGFHPSGHGTCACAYHSMIPIFAKPGSVDAYASKLLATRNSQLRHIAITSCTTWTLVCVLYVGANLTALHKLQVETVSRVGQYEYIRSDQALYPHVYICYRPSISRSAQSVDRIRYMRTRFPNQPSFPLTSSLLG